MTREEWQITLGDRMVAEAKKKREAAGKVQATFEQFLNPFERWVYEIYQRYAGMKLGALYRLAQKEGCPRADVDRFWNKLTKWKSKLEVAEPEPCEPDLFVARLPIKDDEEPPF